MTRVGSIASASVFLYTLLVLVRTDCHNNSQGANNEEVKLHKSLLCDYNTNFRPVRDHKRTVTVKVLFWVKDIKFDALEESLKLHSWVSFSWNDEFLKWTPSDFGDIKETHMKSHEIWTPSIKLYNADASLHQWDKFLTTCSVTNNGSVACVPPLEYSAICRTSLRRWPYDLKNCTLNFGSYTDTAEQVNFTFDESKAVDLEDYQNGPGWTLLKVLYNRVTQTYSCCPNSTYPILIYTFILKREVGGPTAIIVVPSIVIIILTLASLLLDIKDNTRLFLACFSLFGHFTFLIEIGYNIPKRSLDTPILLIFIRDSMVMTLIAILTTLVLVALRQRTEPAPMWIVTVNRLVSTSPGKYVIFTEFDISDIADEEAVTEESTGVNIGQRLSNAADWMKFANIINSCIFIISCIMYLVLIISYIPVDD